MIQRLKIDPHFMTGAPIAEVAIEGSGAGTSRAPTELGLRRRLALRLPDGAEVPLDGRITVGQSSANSVVLRDERVSRRHCEIEVTHGRVTVRDLKSTNGTFVNGARVTTAELGPGSVLLLGRSRLRVTVERTEEIVGDSEPMQLLRSLIPRYAMTDLPVLITGETGTGKELVARALHDHSGRRGAFIPLNCGSIAKELVESELFGHERGAFTGASTRRQGVFQEADGGTLFLDEVGELPLSLQPRLLRALEGGVVRPVGANREVNVAVRVVAATHVDLEAAVGRGHFRRDLFYRLNAAVLTAPPLRARRTDLRALAERILGDEAGIVGACRLSEGALQALQAHSWPGNVRELKNVLRRAAALHGPTLEPQHLQLAACETAPPTDEDEVVRIEGRAYVDIERDVLAKAIQRHGGNRRAAAQALQIPKSTLCDKARRYGIDEE